MISDPPRVIVKTWLGAVFICTAIAAPVWAKEVLKELNEIEARKRGDNGQGR